MILLPYLQDDIITLFTGWYYYLIYRMILLPYLQDDIITLFTGWYYYLIYRMILLPYLQDDIITLFTGWYYYLDDIITLFTGWYYYLIYRMILLPYLQDDITYDFRELRRKVEEMGLFHVKPWFYIAHLAHILLLEILSYTILSYYGVSWMPYIIVVLLLTTSQVSGYWFYLLHIYYNNL